MGAELTPLEPTEVAVVPVAGHEDLVLAVGRDIREGGSPVPKALVDAAIDKGGLLGGATAAKGLLDGSLVRLAPQTVRQLKQGAVFVKDKQGYALGTLKGASGSSFTNAARFVPGAANPAAAGLILQTMAVQHQLGQIQEALETVNLKLDLLLEGQQYSVLSDLASVAKQLDELRAKAAAGNELTAADEIKIRDYEDVCLRRAHEATLWLGNLRDLLTADSLPLREHHDQLEQLLEKHVAFWVRIFVLSRLSLAQARTLQLYRASTSEPEEWVQQLADRVRQDLTGIGGELVGLVNDLDDYLRRHDIASGLSELSLSKKATVRRLRRELWRTHEGLRDTLATTLPSLPLPADEQPPELPGPLRRRDFEPHPVRDNLGKAQRSAARKAKEAGEWAEDRALRGIDRAGRSIQERRDHRQHEREDSPRADD